MQHTHQVWAVQNDGYTLKCCTFCMVCGESAYLKDLRCQAHQAYRYGRNGTYTLEEVARGDDIWDEDF